MATRCLALAMLVVIGTLVLGYLPGISAQCKVDLAAMRRECEEFAKLNGKNDPPSPACCAILKNADIPCLCKRVNFFIERFISIEKGINVAKACGCTVPAGTKCGSYTVPPKA